MIDFGINGTLFSAEYVERIIKKQEPKRPKKNKAFNVWECQNCYGRVNAFSCYCERCGQRLDWSK